ncbi:MAG: hypothetical protein R2712_22505 [Vicinamibacterales bacterium]
MSPDFGHIKKIMRDLDHKILVTPGDTTFTNPDLFEPEGIVVLQGKGPSVENVAVHVWDQRRRGHPGEVPGPRSRLPDRSHDPGNREQLLHRQAAVV